MDAKGLLVQFFSGRPTQQLFRSLQPWRKKKGKSSWQWFELSMFELVKWPRSRDKHVARNVSYDSHTPEDIYQQLSIYLKSFPFDLFLDSSKNASLMRNPLRLPPPAYKWCCWGGKKTYSQSHSWGLGPDSAADICEALVSFRVVWCIPEMTTLPPTKVGSAYPETKQWLAPRRGVTSACSRLVKETTAVRDHWRASHWGFSGP